MTAVPHLQSDKLSAGKRVVPHVAERVVHVVQKNVPMRKVADIDVQSSGAAIIYRSLHVADVAVGYRVRQTSYGVRHLIVKPDRQNLVSGRLVMVSTRCLQGLMRLLWRLKLLTAVVKLYTHCCERCHLNHRTSLTGVCQLWWPLHTTRATNCVPGVYNVSTRCMPGLMRLLQRLKLIAESASCRCSAMSAVI